MEVKGRRPGIATAATLALLFLRLREEDKIEVNTFLKNGEIK